MIFYEGGILARILAKIYNNQHCLNKKRVNAPGSGLWRSSEMDHSLLSRFQNEVGIFIFLDKHGMGVMSDLRF